jgi:hypothetical protein
MMSAEFSLILTGRFNNLEAWSIGLSVRRSECWHIAVPIRQSGKACTGNQPLVAPNYEKD